MTRPRTMLALLGALLLTVGSLGVAHAQGEAGSPEGAEWRLSQYVADGGLVPVPEGVEATLVLDAGSAGGDGGCNVFTGSYSIDGEAITFGSDVIRTQMFCEGDAQVVEDAYLAALPTVAMWFIEDGVLRLLDADGAPILEFGASASDGSDDLATLRSEVDALQARVDDLEARVATLETGAVQDDVADPAAENGTQASTPRSPAARGSVDTVFPEYLRDPFTPPDEVEDRNREVVRWRDRSDDEDGFHVYARRGYCVLREGVDPQQVLDEEHFRLARGPAVSIARLPADRQRYRPDHLAIDAQLPEKAVSPYSNDEFYDVYVASVNEAGESSRVKVASFFLTPEFRCP